MQDERKVKIIDGQGFSFGYLKVEDALDTTVMLMKTFLAPLGALIGNMDGNVMDADLSKINIEAACVHLSQNLKSEQVKELAQKLIKTTLYEPGELADKLGRLDVQMGDFQGKTKLLMKVLAASLEVNFGDFFDVLKGLMTRAKGRLSAQAKTPSDGKSGE